MGEHWGVPLSPSQGGITPVWGWVHSPQPARKRRSPEKRQGGLPKGAPSSTYTMWPTVWPGVASASKVRQPTLTFSLSASGLCREQGAPSGCSPQPQHLKIPTSPGNPSPHIGVRSVPGLCPTWYWGDGLVGECRRHHKWWLGMELPQIYMGATGVQDLLGELWDGIESATIHPAGVVLLAERLVPSAVVPADREVRDPKCAPLYSPPLNGAGLGVTSAGATFTAATNPPRATACPYQCLCVQNMASSITPSSSMAAWEWEGNMDREIRGDREPKYQFLPKPCPLPAPQVLDEPCHAPSCLGHLRAAV